MLRQFSRLERGRNFVILAFAILMGLSLVFFYAPRQDAIVSPATSQKPVAEVGREDVTVSDLTLRRESFMNQMSMFGGQISLAQMGGNRRFLNDLITSRMISQEAARLGLAASNEELRDEFLKIYRSSGQSSFKQFREGVVRQFGSADRYEQMVRDSIAQRKLRAYVAAGASVSDDEVQREFVRSNTSFDLVYVPVEAEALAKTVTISDEDARRFFDEHKEEFRFNEPQKKIQYLYVEQEKVGQKMQVSDEDLRKEYDQLSPENKQAGVRVQQIVLKVANPALDQQVLEKATQIAQSIRDEQGNATEEKFAEAARGQSEDPATAQNGGWLPGLVRRNPSKPNDILQATLAMNPGQVQEPVKTGNAYYIFRRGDAVEKTFEQAKQELLVSLRNRQSYRAASELAARAAEHLKQSKDVRKTAEQFAAEANMSVADMVRETPFIKPGDDVPNIGSAPQFEDAVAPLNNPGDVGDRVGVRGGFAVPLLVERRDPRIPEFDEVRAQATERAKEERAKSQLEQTARDLANSANPDALKAAAEKLGLKGEPMPSYRLGSPIAALGTSPQADELINNLKAGEVGKTPVKLGDSWVVVGVTKRTDADMAEFGKQQEQLKQTAIEERRTQIFGDYLAALRERFDREGKITIYEDVLKQLEAAEPTVNPPAAPRMPPLQIPPQ
ncbi:MAG TPA: peptidyl-prolyl cis-trans isomerase [Pyrinomonadaceae bacterium]|nr:peptidyl-prolyl cis-trans isomerase [Pyrinomonadaceae bacterium]